jgi:hypothetical protein
VGQNPDSFPDVLSSGIVRAQHPVRSHVAQAGQVPKNSSESPRSEEWGVFHEDEAGSNLTNDPGEFRPEAGPSSGNPSTFPSTGNILARESAADNVDGPSPGLSIEGPNIIPDGEGLKDSIPLPSEEGGSGLGIKLNSADGAPSKELASQDSASCPCK